MKPVILFRPEMRLEDEEAAARRFFHVVHRRTEVPPDSLVVGRYSVLPFYRELEEDLRSNGSVLINSFREHQMIADVMEWAPVLGDLTPRTWDRIEDIPDEGPFVLKGQTNSRKDRWDTHMFARDKQEAVQVFLRLSDDSLIGTQRIYVREYVPLMNLGTGLNGMPISEEFRIFYLDGQAVDWSFYWASHADDVKMPIVKDDIFKCADEAVRKLKSKLLLPRFLVVDVARRANGRPIVVELNDGQMSGLSLIEPVGLYATMSTML